MRGKTLTITVYRPALAQPLGTIFMGSGDVGWVGLAVDLSQFLSAKGYTVVGINVRQYLGAFTNGKATLTTKEPPGDYECLFHFLTEKKLITPPVIVSGVSEGAALAVLAGASAQNRSWVNGVHDNGAAAEGRTRLAMVRFHELDHEEGLERADVRAEGVRAGHRAVAAVHAAVDGRRVRDAGRLPDVRERWPASRRSSC